MDLKTVLVNLNHEQRAPELIAAAIAMARPFEAHIAGLYVMPPLFTPSDLVVPMGPEFYEQQISAHRSQANRVKAVFERLTSGEPVVAEWRIHGDPRDSYEAIAEGVIAQSRAADLVIVSQAIAGKDSDMLVEIPESVALESGRPVLVVPFGWQPNQYGNDIAIAWNNGRESARAVFDALPLLRRAKKVRLISVGEQIEGKGANEVPAADVASTLARHGLDVEVETVNGNGWHTGNAILSRLAEDGSDMLVMGAYGHSRLREFVLGGATRDVLKNMTVPVLMSH